MGMNIEIGFYNMWLIFVAGKIFIVLLMSAGSKLRGAKIVNTEDHKNIVVRRVSFLPLVAFLGISIFTPITTGALFWIGCILLFVVGTIYVLTIIAFVRSPEGLTTIGIYRVSRNPMYVAMFLSFIAFTFMIWQAEVIAGILALFITITSVFVIKWMVYEEEHFLAEKYGDAYSEYVNKTARYI